VLFITDDMYVYGVIDLKANACSHEFYLDSSSPELLR